MLDLPVAFNTVDYSIQTVLILFECILFEYLNIYKFEMIIEPDNHYC